MEQKLAVPSVPGSTNAAIAPVVLNSTASTSKESILRKREKGIWEMDRITRDQLRPGKEDVQFTVDPRLWSKRKGIPG